MKKSLFLISNPAIFSRRSFEVLGVSPRAAGRGPFDRAANNTADALRHDPDYTRTWPVPVVSARLRDAWGVMARACAADLLDVYGQHGVAVRVVEIAGGVPVVVLSRRGLAVAICGDRRAWPEIVNTLSH